MNVLAFFAHPDDETILCGGTLALLARAGARVHYLCATRGEGGETGDPPLTTPEGLGAVREQEMVCAVQKLGAASLTFLGYSDPLIGAGDELFAYTEDLAALAGHVTLHIRQFDIDAVFTHGSNGEYGHPAHVLTHQAVRLAVESFGEQAPAFYTVAAIYPDHPRPRLANQDDPADLVLDISPALEAKTEAALCHQTQHALFTRRASEEAGRPLGVPEVIISWESIRRTRAGAAKSDRVMEWLQPFARAAG